ncbi:MAG: BON domain-containing protein [Chloroflexi bacterium]|nr:BON domain-containing protein [Chloroflexota bacterium]
MGQQFGQGGSSAQGPWQAWQQILQQNPQLRQQFEQLHQLLANNPQLHLLAHHLVGAMPAPMQHFEPQSGQMPWMGGQGMQQQPFFGGMGGQQFGGWGQQPFFGGGHMQHPYGQFGGWGQQPFFGGWHMQQPFFGGMGGGQQWGGWGQQPWHTGGMFGQMPWQDFGAPTGSGGQNQMPWQGSGAMGRGQMPWQGMGGSSFGGAKFDDDQIRSIAYDFIDADSMVPWDTDLTVEVRDGVVTITGQVPHKWIKYAIDSDLFCVPGVQDVNNQVKVVNRRQEQRREAMARTGGGGEKNR